jgi:hypothetical protein
MSVVEVPENETDKRASQGPSLSLSLHPSTQPLAGVEYRTLWVMAKMFGRSTIRYGALVVEDSFANPFGINESETISDAAAERTSNLDPEKLLVSSSSQEEILPPCDGGRQAWACLLGAATVESLIWGMYSPRFLNLFLTSLQDFH